MKSVFCAGAGIQSVLFFLNGGYLPAGRELSPRTRIGPFHRPPYCLRQQGPTPADGPRRNSRSTELQNLSLRSAFGQGAALL